MIDAKIVLGRHLRNSIRRCRQKGFRFLQWDIQIIAIDGCTGRKKDMTDMKKDILGLKEEIKDIRFHIENVTDKNISLLADSHCKLFQRLNENNQALRNA